MGRLFVKVCGITRVQDAKSAYLSGADLVGFILYKNSQRFISQANADEIIRTLPPTISKVGVFVDENIDRIIRITQKLKLDFVQLSGNEKKSEVSLLQKTGIKVIKTFHIAGRSDVKAMINHQADILHLDTADKELYGGVGKQFDWRISIPKSIDNLMLAGGLNEDNVIEGIKKYKPLIVDLNSGVESKPGVKSKAKLERIFSKLNRYRYGTKTR